VGMSATDDLWCVLNDVCNLSQDGSDWYS